MPLTFLTMKTVFHYSIGKNLLLTIILVTVPGWVLNLWFRKVSLYFSPFSKHFSGTGSPVTGLLWSQVPASLILATQCQKHHPPRAAPVISGLAWYQKPPSQSSLLQACPSHCGSLLSLCQNQSSYLQIIASSPALYSQFFPCFGIESSGT